MRRSLPLVLTACLVALGAGIGMQPTIRAQAAGCDVTLVVGVPQTFAGSGAAFSKVVCVANPGSGTRVLDVMAHPTDAVADGFLCVDAVPDLSVPGTVVRDKRSHLPGNKDQRAAIQSPFKSPGYKVTFSPGGTACTTASTTPYSVTIQAYDSPDQAFSNGFAFHNQLLPASLGTSSVPGGGEPSIVVDRLHGNRTYISAPAAVPSGASCIQNVRPPTECNGVLFWYSTDGGNTFTFCNPSLPNGGGDSHLALDTTGSIYSVDLALSNVDTQKMSSTASGPPTPDKNASECGFTNTNPTAPEADRQWLTTYLPDPSQGTGAAKVYLSYHDFALGVPLECTGLAGGADWAPVCAPMVDPTNPDVADAVCNTVVGNQVVDSKGNIYGLFEASTPGDNLQASIDQQFPCPAPNHNIFLAKSSDGVTFTNSVVHVTRPLHSLATDYNNSIAVGGLFPVIAIDKADNLYSVWSQQVASGGPASVMYRYSTDHGTTWSAAKKLNPPNMPSAVLPWVVAGENGGIDVVWVGSDTDKPNSMAANSDWFVYMAQSLNAASPNATFAVTKVTQQPIRYGWICFLGLLCNTAEDGRILLDFIMVDVDSNCMANVSYANAGPDTSAQVGSGRSPWTAFAKQTAGQPLGSNCRPRTTTATGNNNPTNPSNLPNTGAIQALNAGSLLPPLAVLPPAALIGGAAAGVARRRRRRSTT